MERIMSFDRRLFTTDLSHCFSLTKRHFVSGLCGIAVLTSFTVSVFAAPVITSFEAKLDGENVVQAPPNSTITLTAVAEDADSNPLSFTWSVNAGTIISSSGSEAQWQLPISGGLHFAYVFVTNSNNEKVEGGVTISTDGSAIFGSQSVATPATSDKIPQTDHFLNYLGANVKEESCNYYLAIDTGGDCIDGNLINPEIDFTKWKNKWGLNDSSTGVRAIYANKTDLNLQRNMHGISNADGTAYYVCNYPRVDDLDEGANLDNAIHNLNLAACVAMENSSDGNGGERFTKFYAFGPSGDLLQSVNLDGRGEKYIPGSCVVCHGGSSYPKNKNDYTDVNLGSSFLPFDLDNFVFSNHPGLSKLEQQSSLRQLNEWIRDNTNPRTAISELITGWYSKADIAFDSDFAPKNWEFDDSDVPLSTDSKQLYRDVVKPYCRTCHVALSPSLSSFSSFAAYAYNLVALVCGNTEADSINLQSKMYQMPNARVTFDRFWNSAGVETFRKFLKDEKIKENPGLLNFSGICNPPQ